MLVTPLGEPIIRILTASRLEVGLVAVVEERPIAGVSLVLGRKLLFIGMYLNF